MIKTIKKFFNLLAICLIIASVNCYAAENNKSIDASFIKAMKTYHVPVVGYAIIKDYKIIAVKTISIDPNIKTSSDSLFQAASISKSVSAYGALKLVSQGKLTLDNNVNFELKTWKIPTNKYNENDPVTLRMLLNMTSGLSVSGFPGHPQGEPLPTLLAVLNGKPPANTGPISVFYRPGTKYFYSGGAFQVLEQLIEDNTYEPFQTWMQKQILTPLQMQHSLFQYPLPKSLRANAVPAFLSNDKMIPGGWNNYAIYAAGGLWSTPTDLAKFSIQVSNAYLGRDNSLISPSIAKQMLTRNVNTDYGLGFVVSGANQSLNFRKAGHNLGYHDELLMFPNTGDGVVIMTDSENGETILDYMIPIIAKKYHWPSYFPFFDELIEIPNYI